MIYPPARKYKGHGRRKFISRMLFKISADLFIIVFILQIALIVLLVLLYDKYKQLQKSYNTFMEGKNGKYIRKAKLRNFRMEKKLLFRIR